ncbi:hypothetical protein BHM03_00046835 [Ensete ventricosum]|nr:hypothetical protein BHM03_00046835 [Ensete ventricosum]
MAAALSSSCSSSSAAALACRNSCIRIPGRPSVPSVSSTTLCCSLAMEAMKPGPKKRESSMTASSGQQETDPHSRIISSRELEFLSAYSTPLKPLNPLLYLDSMGARSSNRSDMGSILVSTSTLFSSSKPMASLRQMEIARFTLKEQRSRKRVSFERERKNESMGGNADLAGVVGIGIAAPFLERGDHVSSGRAVVLHARDAKLDHMADVPKAGAFVHVFVEPLATDREVELLHQVGELGVERPEQARGAVEELEGHEGVGREGAVEIV